jgi:hypothetical protein
MSRQARLSIVHPSRHGGHTATRAILLMVAMTSAAFALLMSGCTDLKPLQAEVEALKSQVMRLQSETAAARQSADQAASAAQSASQAASGAQSAANQAISAAQSSQACCDSNNEKIERMFRRSVEK